MNTISYIAAHHSGGLGTNDFASTKHLTLAQIDNGHRLRWPGFPSDIKNPATGKPYYTGYNIVVFPDGTWIQTRLIGAETAAQIGHNFDAASICAIGNFMKQPNGLAVDVMPTAQLQTIQKLLKGILDLSLINDGTLKVLAGTKFDFSYTRIQPHRILQPNHTSCYGTYLPDDWARQLALAPLPTPQKPLATPEDIKEVLSIYQQIQVLMARLQDIFAKKRFGKELERVGGVGRSCGNILLE